MSEEIEITSKFISNIQEIDPQQWNALLPKEGSHYPFVQHRFLALLESSGVVGKIDDEKEEAFDTGWQPFHYCVFKEEQLIAAMPLYQKQHSMGEYVFDWGWADAYHRYGLSYYPKLTACIPFTPVTGPRLLLHPQAPEHITRWITQDLLQQTRQSGASSIHVLFPEPSLSEQFKAQNWLQRKSVQFQWFNHHYTNFEDFLANFSSRKRKNVRKERAGIEDSGIKIERLSGNEITPQHMQLFFHCYQQTYLKRSGHGGYLNREFFMGLLEIMADNLMLVVASRNSIPIASALYFRDNTHLYGRYWGCLQDVKDLHFECCYYQGIEYCIEQGLKEFNPGTQGEHKIQRGFEPIFCYSNHWLAEPAFHRAVQNFLLEEEPHINLYKQEAERLLPFKQ
ncbi:N-acetyltransferase [Paraneptunicella aestuarii]|uniref:GNAT family N-acetyltransferase n=1 Tax=Paraneptunicella aestuarii TaxID=2831148 RepID=UPI001E2DE0EF|nr:GNAT family N-acetyltransferase [Paraneptunicella aestuarii]UAA37941.1 N-acetyltransferase [Paraneptunicella aestuarii]